MFFSSLDMAELAISVSVGKVNDQTQAKPKEKPLPIRGFHARQEVSAKRQPQQGYQRGVLPQSEYR
jgi:hypothetical protein